MLRRKRVAAATVALCALLGATTVAVAGDDERPRTDRVEAAITFSHASFRERLCEGQEGGPYVESRVVATGTSAGDLAGEVTARIELLIELDTGDGFERGTLVIRDPESGRKVLDARFENGDIDEISQGSLFGRVRDGGSEDNDRARFFGNWRVTFHENGAVTAQIGGVAPDGRLPAVATSGECSGPFVTGEGDIPPPEAVTATVSRSHGRWAVSR